MKLITKNIFLSGYECLLQSWYMRNNSNQPIPSLEDCFKSDFRKEQGKQIGKKAQYLYPDGIIVDEGCNITNNEKTKKLINDPLVTAIFEATFIYSDFIARADILVRLDNEWHLIEVKSGLASDKVNAEFINDLAYTALILTSCGIKLKQTSLLLLSKQYRLGMKDEDLFVTQDCTRPVYEQILNFRNHENEISLASSQITSPQANFIFACKNCDYYKTECLGKNIDNPIFDLPMLSKSKFSSLAEEKIFTIETIPEIFKLTSMQERVRNSVIKKEPYVEKTMIREWLNKIIFPIFYLDFESVSTPIPIYRDTAPYEKILTQYSIHKISATGEIPQKIEYLSNHEHDERRSLALRLINDIEKSGSIIVYHAGAEISDIKKLMEIFPDLSTELASIINRIIDLKAIIKEAYYHFDFHGSFSIKDVLPVLAPEMNYTYLAIKDGESAMIHYAKMALGEYKENEIKITRSNLLEYCAQDTLAMVKIHERLNELISKN